MTPSVLTWEIRDPGACVLQVTNMWPDPNRPVYGVFVRRQVESLRRRGLACDVLYLRGYLGPHAYALAAASFARSSVSWRGRYRVIHVHAGETALAARSHVGAPLVASYVGDDLLGDRRDDGTISPRARARAALIRSHSLLFPATITKSQAMEAVLPAATRRRNSVIPNGVDRTLFAPLDRAEARRRLGWDAAPVALFAATKPRSPNKRLWLAEEATRRAGVRLHVAATEDPNTMPVLMSAADCLLLTSAVEGSPNAVKEALMCGLPVVATPAGDVHEILANVTPSFVCPPDPDALAVAVRACVEGVRSNGRDEAAWLGEDAIADRILAVYERLAPGVTPR